MRHFTKIEAEVLTTISAKSDEAANAIGQIIDTLISEQDAGANSSKEIDRIDELLEAQSQLNNVSIYIDNAS